MIETFVSNQNWLSFLLLDASSAISFRGWREEIDFSTRFQINPDLLRKVFLDLSFSVTKLTKIILTSLSLSLKISIKMIFYFYGKNIFFVAWSGLPLLRRLNLLISFLWNGKGFELTTFSSRLNVYLLVPQTTRPSAFPQYLCHFLVNFNFIQFKI